MGGKPSLGRASQELSQQEKVPHSPAASLLSEEGGASAL